MTINAGQIVRWNDDKGFGFIRPDSGSVDIFLHITALPPGQQPRIGARVLYSAGDDPQGRGPRALKAVIEAAETNGAGTPPARTMENRVLRNQQASRQTGKIQTGSPAHPRPRNTELRQLPLNGLTLLVACCALFCLAGAVSMFRINPIPLLAYPAASLILFLLYARDKYSAIHGNWRVPESTLHLIEAMGGWPGAYVAQQMMRHKTVKSSYQVVFWLIVAIHVAFWVAWILDLGSLHRTLNGVFGTLGRRI